MARHRYELWGESLREIGVLLVVFVPLENLIRAGKPNWENVVVFSVIGLILILVGTEIERS